MTSETSTGSKRIRVSYEDILVCLRENFGEMDGIYEEEEGAEQLRQAAAELFAISDRVLARCWELVLSSADSYIVLLRGKTKLKEERDDLEKKVVELDRRLRDPNRLRPDPLGPSVPRGGKPELVGGERGPGPTVPRGTEPWCPGTGYIDDAEPRPGEDADCVACGRLVKPRREGQPSRHKWGGYYNVLYWEHVAEGKDPLRLGE